MQIDSKTLLCRYQYDALNRLIASTPLAQTTEIQGAEQRSIMQHEDQLLAQQQRQSGPVETCLLVTDQQSSVLNVLAAARRNPLAYTPYGHRHPENGLLSLLGFNGERPDPVTGCYLLGNGYRAFNPVLMRFNSPDSWSPFGEGGLNAYAYCVGDPVNRGDPTGHSNWLFSLFKGIANRLNIRTPSSARQVIGTAGSTENMATHATNPINLDPPPPYSPPRNRRPSFEPTSDPGLALTTESDLLSEINRREASASIQRSFLNDITNGHLQVAPGEHASRVTEWHQTQISIVALKERIPLPSYKDVLDTDKLPSYQSAVRRSR
ncbi:RHS repeat-associated core domain-containing protein [Pseudomonas frederiksbergensis]|uniref:RHS repeat-associated core domain-containing protein n=1 Tax=Pseudomonas frederiksbergensis TaxID=104087 RepID=UPI000F462359|nr:RHS repeat-associated core domain-containing protein [Pseudomonas frederiksbergensis]